MVFNVGNIASRTVVVAEPHTPVTKVAELIRENHIGAIIIVEDRPPKNRPIGIITDPVIDNEQRLVGIVTLDDVVDLLAKELGDLTKAIWRGQKHEERVRK